MKVEEIRAEQVFTCSRIWEGALWPARWLCLLPPAVLTQAQQPVSPPVLLTFLPANFDPDSDLSLARNSDQAPLKFGGPVAPES